MFGSPKQKETGIRTESIDSLDVNEASEDKPNNVAAKPQTKQPNKVAPKSPNKQTSIDADKPQIKQANKVSPKSPNKQSSIVTDKPQIKQSNKVVAKSPNKQTSNVTAKENIEMVNKMRHLYGLLKSQTEPDRDIIGPFMLKPSREIYPDYYNFIKNPIDMETIDANINSNHYKTMKKFRSDVNLMFENCKFYNESESLLHQDACKLQKFFNKVRNLAVFSMFFAYKKLFTSWKF